LKQESTRRTCVVIHNHPIHYKHLLFKALAKTGLDFEVLFTGAFSRDRLEAPLPEANEYRYRVGSSGAYESVPARLAASFVWRSLGQLQPQTVIISGYYDVAGWTAWTWARVHGAKRILWAESNEFDHPRHFIKELPKRLFVKNCDLAHVYGTSNAAYVEKLGMARNRIYIKRAVADTSRFLQNEELKKPSTGPRELLYVGRFVKEKNLELLLRALGALEQDRSCPDLVLSLVGYGPVESDLRMLAKELGLENVVRFRGKALQTQLPEIYREADAFILPSTYEPWGLVANEAMLCGLPVLLSTQCGCTQDLVKPDTGWSFSPWDENALLRLLEVVVSTPCEHLRQMGRVARELAAEYSPENCADVVFRTVSNGISV